MRRVNTDLGTFTATGAGDIKTFPDRKCTIEATGDSNGGIFTSATIDIQVRNDAAHGWKKLGTLSVSGDGGTDGFSADAPWAYVRANVTAFSGSGSTPQVLVNFQV